MLFRSFYGYNGGAVRLKHERYNIFRKNSGSFHVDTIEAMGSLADILLKQEKFDEADPLQSHILDFRGERIGPTKSRTIRSMEDRTMTWRKLGRCEEVKSLQMEVLELRKGYCDIKDPATLNTMLTLARTWNEHDEFFESERLYREALESNTATSGREDTVSTTLDSFLYDRVVENTSRYKQRHFYATVESHRL